jgi:CrcB protein
MPDRRMMTAVFVGGAIGTLVRAALATSYPLPASQWPWPTFAIVNLSGALVLGLLTGLSLGREESLLAGTAVVGSYTTFSTWMFETQRLGEDRQVPLLVANLSVSLVAGVLAAAAGRWIGLRL